jgi:hypothetical protein
LNIAQDAGTYLYNAPPPWDNPLTGAALHNTLTVNGEDQMRRAGRFLYLDWAQGEFLMHGQTGDDEVYVVQHRGYDRLGAVHRRTVLSYAGAAAGGHWEIRDDLFRSGSKRVPGEKIFKARLHWLLPDWDWEIQDFQPTTKNSRWKALVKIRSPYGWVEITIQVGKNHADKEVPHIQLGRAGERIYGKGDASPVEGWVSLTYGVKRPALSLAVEIEAPLPIEFVTGWHFPDES